MARLLFLALVTLIFVYTIESAVVKTSPTVVKTPTAVTQLPAGVVKTPTAVGGNTGKVCSPVKCPGKPKVCAYGYQKKDGCEICKCNDPCNPPGKVKLCGPNQRCSVEKKPDGTFGSRCDVASSKKGKGGKAGKDGQTASSKADCKLPKASGPCRAALPRFHYNSATKSCESFTYGGCQGNGNNFETKAQCEATCKA